jgi:hypothetical protein
MRWVTRLVLLVSLLACDSSNSPTAPEVGNPFPFLSYTGQRLLSVLEGEETCLGRLLSSLEPTPIRFEIGHRPDPSFVGTLWIGEGRIPRESCSVTGTIAGQSIGWRDYKCYPNCWWESFECGGRRWSFCRRPQRGGFVGTIGDRQMAGRQIVPFHATLGDESYEVLVEFDYRLDRKQ